MTDFDTRILDEDTDAAIPAAAGYVAEDVDRRRARNPEPTAMPQMPSKGQAPEKEPTPGRERAPKKEQASRDTRGDAGKSASEHPGGGATAAASPPGPGPTGEAARRRLLGTAVVALARAPERLDLRPLAAAYEAAPARETATAADALLCAYLRVATETRRRARPVLAEQLAQARGSSLAQALADRLGAVAMAAPAFRPTPPVTPPAPTEEHEHRPEEGEA